MAENDELYAVPGQLLNDIGLAVKTKLDDMTDIPVEDLPMKIGMIEGGGIEHDIKSSWLGSAVGLFKNQNLGGVDTLKLDLSHVDSMSSIFLNTTGVRKAIIKCPAEYMVDCRSFVGNTKDQIEEIHFETPLLCRLLTFGIYKPVKITGGIGLMATSGNNTWRIIDLEEIEFIPNGIFTNLSLYDSAKLSDNSLVSIANGLCTADRGRIGTTLTLHAIPKARCSSIVGTITKKEDSVGIYDYFEQDDNGAVTLSAFINNIKGWVIA